MSTSGCCCRSPRSSGSPRVGSVGGVVMAGFFHPRAVLKPTGAVVDSAGETRRIRSSTPLSVVTSRSPSRADVTNRSRPNCCSARGDVPTRGAGRVEVEEQEPASLRRGDGQGAAGHPTPRRAPTPRPRWRWSGTPEDQAASCWMPGSDWSVIGDRLVVAGNRVPAVVAARDEPVDLVVAVAAVLDRPERAVIALGKTLHVAVAVGEDEPPWPWSPGVGVVWQGAPVLAVHAQHLAAQRVEVAGVGADGRVSACR